MSALHLRQQGHDVIVLDRQAKPAAETSHANGGQISVSHAVGKTNSNLAMWWLLLAAVLVGLVMPARAQAPPSGCNVSLDQVRLANPLLVPSALEECFARIRT